MESSNECYYDITNGETNNDITESKNNDTIICAYIKRGNIQSDKSVVINDMCIQHNTATKKAILIKKQKEEINSQENVRICNKCPTDSNIHPINKMGLTTRGNISTLCQPHYDKRHKTQTSVSAKYVIINIMQKIKRKLTKLHENVVKGLKNIIYFN